MTTINWKPVQEAKTAAQESAPSAEQFLAEANSALRRAGCRMAERALFVAREYDGIHRLLVSVAEWVACLANEGGRAPNSNVAPNPEEEPELKEKEGEPVPVRLGRDANGDLRTEIQDKAGNWRIATLIQRNGYIEGDVIRVRKILEEYGYEI